MRVYTQLKSKSTKICHVTINGMEVRKCMNFKWSMLFKYIMYTRQLCISTMIASLCHKSVCQPISDIKNGLIAYYPFDGNTLDMSGNENHLTSVGAPTFKSSNRFGMPQRSIELDGIKDYLILDKAIHKSSFVRTPLTISFWRKGTGGDSAVGVESLSTVLWSVGGKMPYAVRADENVGIVGGRSEFFLVASFADSDWIHTAFVWNGTESTGYTNGSVALRATLPDFGPAPSDSRLYVGADPYAGFEYWSGQFDDLRIYERALSESEVMDLYRFESSMWTTAHPATATAQVINGFVVGATITDAGYGYTNAPKVKITGGGGSGASAVATIDAQGVVNSIKLVASGSGYTGTPSILIEDPPFPPTQAKGTANVVNGFITGVTLSEQGHGYGLTAPPVTFLGGGGSGAEGVAVVENGKVTRVIMTATGSGYTSTPKVLIAVPPGYPSLSIRVNQVTVNLNVLVGYRYKLQTSTTSGGTWSDVGSTFLATESTYSQVVDVKDHMQLFRIVQGP